MNGLEKCIGQDESDLHEDQGVQDLVHSVQRVGYFDVADVVGDKVAVTPVDSDKRLDKKRHSTLVWSFILKVGEGSIIFLLLIRKGSLYVIVICEYVIKGVDK